MDRLALRLIQARRYRGFTLAEVAENMEISTELLEKMEAGNVIPNARELKKLSGIYGMSADWFLKGDETDKDVSAVTERLSDRIFKEESMYELCENYAKERNCEQTLKALPYARDMHKGQIRKGKDRVPFIYHPLFLACHAISLGIADDDLLAACVLHDVPEDCGVSPSELPVSKRVQDAVRLLTKSRDFDRSDAAETAYFSAIAGNRISAIVKLLDRCHNVTSMTAGFSEKRLAQYILETEKYVYPLCDQVTTAFPEYKNELFLVKYHMYGMVEAIRHMISRNQE